MLTPPESLFSRYQLLQAYAGWTPNDSARLRSVRELVKPYLPELVEDFYAEVVKHPETRAVITGGDEQIGRLKGTMLQWIEELFSGHYDPDYVQRRWRVGWRHVDIGLDQVFVTVALARIRRNLHEYLMREWKGDATDLLEVRKSLNTVLDLDLALINDAYQTELVLRKQKSEREATMRGLLEASPCMIVILRAGGEILYFSPFAEQLTGYSTNSLLGKNFFETFFPGASERQIMCEVIGRVHEGTPCPEFENALRARDGMQRWLVWNAQFLEEHDGAPAVLIVGHDITSLKHAREKTLQGERLAGIGQMITGLAHESGNALARSRACLEMLALEVEDRPEAMQLIQRIEKAQDHLQRLYEEVRNYAAPTVLQREVSNLASVWRQAWNNLSVQRQGRQANLLAETDNLDLHLPIDPFRLEQVFRNIMENALAACPDPVEIRVECAETTWNNSPAVRISIRDNGPGLTSEQRKRIFEPFYTTKTKGTGLGMAIAKRILEAHGGAIDVGPETGNGAEILLILPRAN